MLEVCALSTSGSPTVNMQGCNIPANPPNWPVMRIWQSQCSCATLQSCSKGHSRLWASPGFVQYLGCQLTGIMWLCKGSCVTV